MRRSLRTRRTWQGRFRDSSGGFVGAFILGSLVLRSVVCRKLPPPRRTSWPRAESVWSTPRGGRERSLRYRRPAPRTLFLRRTCCPRCRRALSPNSSSRPTCAEWARRPSRRNPATPVAERRVSVGRRYLTSLTAGIGDWRLPLLREGSRIFRGVVPRNEAQQRRINEYFASAGPYRLLLAGTRGLAVPGPGKSILPVVLPRVRQPVVCRRSKPGSIFVATPGMPAYPLDLATAVRSGEAKIRAAPAAAAGDSDLYLFEMNWLTRAGDNTAVARDTFDSALTRE